MSLHPEERLGPYLEGELGPEDRRLLELHLESCEQCSLALRELRTTVELLRLIPEPLAPVELGRSVMDRIAASERRPVARWRAHLMGAVGSPLPTALGALAATALVVLTLRVVSPSGAPPVPDSLAPGGWPDSARVAEPAPPARDPVVRFGNPPLRPASLRSAPRALPAPFRLRTDRSGGMGVGAAAPAGPEILPPRPELAHCQAFGREAQAEGESVAFGCRPWLSGMLTLAQFDPQGFVGEISLLPHEERNAWLGELVGFAARSGSVARVVAGLRSSVDPGSALLAERFERGSLTAPAE